jgi:hypothetical protein
MLKQRLPKLFLFLFLLLFLSLFSAPIHAAQTYRFSVPELNMQVYVQPDASVLIVYDITFENASFASPIEIVDIGTPHDDYDIRNMRASVDGIAAQTIRPSEFVDPGVEVHLGGQSIGPGETGTLHFEMTIPDLVYEDTTRDDYASLQITPTWFDPESVSGSTNVQIAVHMLPEVQPEELLWQDVPYTTVAVFEEHTVAVWQMPNSNAIEAHLVGVSFPQKGMTHVIEQTLLDLAVKWLDDNPGIHFILGAIAVAILGFIFFRFSGGTGVTVFVILTAGLVFLLLSSTPTLFCALPALLLLLGFNEYGMSKRKPRYLPAIAQVEGGGIKRGLTAPEAAVLLELPLNKILTLVIFGLLEKEIVQQTNEDPLTVEISPEFLIPDDVKKADKRAGKRQAVAQKVGVALRSYEHPFLDVIQASPGVPVSKLDLSEPMKKLIQQSAERVKDFDLSDTQDYYRKIIARAMNEAKSLGDIQMKEKYLDEHLQWLLLDDRYPTVFVAPNYGYQPVWTRPYRSVGRVLGAPAAGSSSAGRPSVGGRTSLGDVAGSFAGRLENTMGSLASAIAPGALQVEVPSGGFVNLSGVDRVTGDIFQALSKASTSGSGGSGGSSCACACAGCACACACAGGGR